MKITLTPYPVKSPPKNAWFFEVKYMFGDADGYTTETYEFDSQEDFKIAYELFDKCIKFRKSHHNLMCTLWDRECTISDLRENEVATAKSLLGEHESIGDMLRAAQDKLNYEINIPNDPSSDGTSASLQRIEDAYYFDGEGNKFSVACHD